MFHRAITRRLVAVAALMVFAAPLRAVQAQSGTITGKVTDAATKLPIADVRVVITGTTFEAQTGRDGEFRLINVRPGAVTVSAFRIGYRLKQDTARVAAGETAVLNLEMTASVINLSEVVVTGTAGNQERKAQSALVASVTAADIIKDAPVTNVANLLQSRVPGVSLNASSGTKGTSTQIRIRGASSINLSNQPLIFVDGVRINEGPINIGNGGAGTGGQAYDRFNDLNPEEIESIEVVKGPAAATLYGADASAGVIQIITKKGRAGSNSFQQSLRIEQGSSSVDHIKIPDNYNTCTAALIAPTSTNPLCRGQALNTLVSDNPLERANVFRKGDERVFNYALRGGGQNYGFNVSYGSDNSTGTLPNEGNNRYNVRTNVNYVANQKLNLDLGLGLVQNSTRLPNNDNNVFGWLGGGMLGDPRSRSDAPNRDATFDGWYSNRHFNAINSIDANLLSKRVTSSVTANYAPTSWFTNRFTGGLDYATDIETRFYPRNDSTWYGGLRDGGENQQFSRGAERYTFDYLGNMKKQLGTDWETNLSFGLQTISSRNQLVQSTGIGFVTNSNRSNNSAATTTGSSGFTEQRQYGYLGQLQVGHLNKRFLQVGVRVDRNSSFGTNSPTFVLPKIGGSWAIGEEDFFQPLTNVINTLRLRAAWGTTGRSPNPGQALETLTSASYNLAGTTFAGANLNRPGNPELKPERGTEFEAGLDAGFLSNRVSMELTYFRKQTDDLIIARPIPPSLGYGLNPLANLGSVLNSGVEVGVNVQAVNSSNFRWDVRGAANTLRNELLSLGGQAPFVLGSIGRTLVGQQLGVMTAKVVKSVDLQNGRAVVTDTLTPVGNLFPTLEWNLTNTFTIAKNLRISAMIDAKKDFVVYNNTRNFREAQLIRSNVRLDTTLLSREERIRRYGPFVSEVTGAAVPINDARGAFIEEGDFVRFRELSATYTLPQSIMTKISGRIQNASVTFAMQNVKLWTNYSGFDPELNAQSNAFGREDFLTAPIPRRTVLRFNLNF
ncbi:MAG TPA: SusC/RagA family TonB-linked outer membrane protein [Gemmatimonas aurantiaca]|uniref:SusC/RagA family TonB-linked outer membrane protein n=2 Tax=Gemmatimonas aurantiaca TaxID=173480 RepID=A0A3D4V4R0_9BACT|nr:SusC/RagA family TonB-linked outer membrane protein [Gemmatimonas aurantiaca]BAH39446.1 putative outer membrane protein [Gemmatimonas aurantiaca T-27]HCT56075.1 SusC/RagA family TonB-linked outer membrane protein [Gemmatimonas aurantiaca]